VDAAKPEARGGQRVMDSASMTTLTLQSQNLELHTSTPSSYSLSSFSTKPDAQKDSMHQARVFPFSNLVAW